MEMFTEIVRVLMFVIIGDLPLLVHFSCRAVQIFFFRCNEGSTNRAVSHFLC